MLEAKLLKGNLSSISLHLRQEKFNRKHKMLFSHTSCAGFEMTFGTGQDAPHSQGVRTKQVEERRNGNARRT
jgi:hypothetical protein